MKFSMLSQPPRQTPRKSSGSPFGPRKLDPDVRITAVPTVIQDPCPDSCVASIAKRFFSALEPAGASRLVCGQRHHPHGQPVIYQTRRRETPEVRALIGPAG